MVPPSHACFWCHCRLQAGHLALPFWSAYNCSKAGLDILSECLRYELSDQGIAVVTVKPGPVRTPIWDKSRKKSQSVLDGMPAEMQQLYGATIDKVRHPDGCSGAATLLLCGSAYGTQGSPGRSDARLVHEWQASRVQHAPPRVQTLPRFVLSSGPAGCLTACSRVQHWQPCVVCVCVVADEQHGGNDRRDSHTCL